MTKQDKKWMAELCEAKNTVCSVCRRHTNNICDQCSINHLLDNELERLQTGKLNAFDEYVDDILDAR